jgi:hypothetical protein
MQRLVINVTQAGVDVGGVRSKPQAHRSSGTPSCLPLLPRFANACMRVPVEYCQKGLCQQFSEDELQSISLILR